MKIFHKSYIFRRKSNLRLSLGITILFLIPNDNREEVSRATQCFLSAVNFSCFRYNAMHAHGQSLLLHLTESKILLFHSWCGQNASRRLHRNFRIWIPEDIIAECDTRAKLTLLASCVSHKFCRNAIYLTPMCRCVQYINEPIQISVGA